MPLIESEKPETLTDPPGQAERPTEKPEILTDLPEQANRPIISSYTASIFNQTSRSIVLKMASASFGFVIKPEEHVFPGHGTAYKSEGTFSNPANGYVVYEGANAPRPTFTNTWAIPAIGNNRISITVEPPFYYELKGDTGGYHPNVSIFIKERKE